MTSEVYPGSSGQARTCQTCKLRFTIEPEDFNFYAKISVPPPTWCPECRLQRRMMVRNERTLYKRKCAGTGKEIIAVYAPENPVPVYDREYYWSDAWDPMMYGREYDFSRPFFEQFGELRKTVPRINLNANFVYNSDYCNYVGDVKNSYLCFGSIAIEDCLYGAPYESKYCVDTYLARECEFCYECLDCEKLSSSLYTQDCSNSFGLIYCFDCKNCQDCIGCAGLRNKKYHILNRPYSKEEFRQQKEALLAGGRKAFAELAEQFAQLKKTVPHRFATVLHCTDIAGDHIVQSKNTHSSFDVKKLEDCKYCIRMIDARNIYDTNYCEFMELCYEYIAFWKNANTKFSNTCGECNEVEYSDLCYGSSRLFGCIGLRKKQYCILNRQYPKEEYEALAPKIIDHMNTMPYVDTKGRRYKYGEFVPPDFSPFAYNETVAQEYFPLTKEEIIAQGYRWRDTEAKHYEITKKPDDLPNHINGVADSITNEIIGCAHEGKCIHQCTTAFRVIPPELQFYRKMNLPLPRLCPNCRHYERLKQRNPLKLWHRKCMCGGGQSAHSTGSWQEQRESSSKGGSASGGQNVYTNTITHFHGTNPCPNEFETSYAPDRPEIVYCEQCYQNEVI